MRIIGLIFVGSINGGQYQYFHSSIRHIPSIQLYKTSLKVYERSVPCRSTLYDCRSLISLRLNEIYSETCFLSVLFNLFVIEVMCNLLDGILTSLSMVLIRMRKMHDQGLIYLKTYCRRGKCPNSQSMSNTMAWVWPNWLKREPFRPQS